MDETDNRFPQMLYRAPGEHQLHGGHFDYVVVDGEAELKVALTKGWRETTPAAVAAAASKAKAKQAAPT